MHFKNNHQISPSTNDFKTLNTRLQIYFLATLNIKYGILGVLLRRQAKTLLKFKSDSTLNNHIDISVCSSKLFLHSFEVLKNSILNRSKHNRYCNTDQTSVKGENMQLNKFSSF